MNNQKPQTGGYAGSTIGALLRVARQVDRGLIMEAREALCRVFNDRLEDAINAAEDKLNNIVGGLPTREEVNAEICKVKDAYGRDAAVACYILEAGSGRAKMADIPEDMFGIVMRKCREALTVRPPVPESHQAEVPTNLTPIGQLVHKTDALYNAWVDRGQEIFNADPTSAGRKRFFSLVDSSMMNQDAVAAIWDGFLCAAFSKQQVRAADNVKPAEPKFDWFDFLAGRSKMIDVFLAQGKSYDQIAHDMNFSDGYHVAMIAARDRSIDHMEAVPAKRIGKYSNAPIDDDTEKVLRLIALHVEKEKVELQHRMIEPGASTITLRDEIAMRVSMADVQACTDQFKIRSTTSPEELTEVYAEARYDIADKMLAARSK